MEKNWGDTPSATLTPLLGLIELIVFYAVSAIFHEYNDRPLLGRLEVVPLLGCCRT